MRVWDSSSVKVGGFRFELTGTFPSPSLTQFIVVRATHVSPPLLVPIARMLLDSVG